MTGLTVSALEATHRHRRITEYLLHGPEVASAGPRRVRRMGVPLAQIVDPFVSMSRPLEEGPDRLGVKARDPWLQTTLVVI
jgi:hypothetical protein